MSEMFDFDSQGRNEAQAFALYRDLYSKGSDVIRTGDPFFARVRAWRLDRTLLFAREYGGVIHRRHERVADDRFDHFVLHHVLDGELIGGPVDAPLHVSPGESLLLDTRYSMENGARAVSLITVSVARDVVRAAAGELDGLHGRRLSARDGALLSAMLRAMVEQAAELSAGAQSTVTRMLVDLLSIAINPAGNSARSDFHRLDYVRREAAQRLIEARLADRNFSVQEITREIGVSRASLYRLFEAQGGVLRFIQLRRLQHLRDRLDDRAFDHYPLAELAPQSGFSSESHASRLFKQAFDLSPGAYRTASIQGTGTQAIELMMRRWSNSMTEIR